MMKKYVLVIPKEALIYKITLSPTADNLMSSALLSKILYYYTVAKISTHPIMKIKLLHLADLYADLTHPKVEDKIDTLLLKSILGNPPFSVGTFDQWWDTVTIDRGAFDLESVNSSVREDIDLKSILASTGVEAFDAWIHDGKDRYISTDDGKQLDSLRNTLSS